MQRIVTDHGVYRIIAGSQAGLIRAIAYLGHRRIETISADTLDAVVEAMRRKLDERLSERVSARSDGVPSPEEFAEALELLWKKFSEAQTAILSAYSRSPESPGRSKIWPFSQGPTR